MSGSATALRRAILTSLPVDPFQIDDPAPRYLYVPRTHVRALDPDNMLVVGARGTGKSFWWQALRSESVRAALKPQTPSMQRGRLKVSAGWSTTHPSAKSPDKDTLTALRRAGLDPRLIWRAVLLFQLAPDPWPLAATTWKARVDWVAANPEPVAERLRACDAALVAADTRHLVLFDELDRTSDTFDDRRALLKGLLQLVLDLRSTRAIRAKVFVRDDMVDDRDVLAFVDASKVSGSRVDLTWPRAELYGLLWQYMGNADEGADVFRSLVPTWKSDEAAWRMPDTLRTVEPTQRRVFAEIAGRAMGTNERRGLPFTWIPTHLGDAGGVATPRSFLTAIRTAAEATSDAAERALDWRNIHSGVRRASEIRVAELAEDFPWTRPAMEALQGLTVPCNQNDLFTRWRDENVLQSIAREPEGRTNKGGGGLHGLLKDLGDIRVIESRYDGRYNIPDVYRVGFGLKRRGGVRPVT